MIIDSTNLDKLTEDQRQQFQAMLAAHPHLQAKADPLGDPGSVAAAESEESTNADGTVNYQAFDGKNLQRSAAASPIQPPPQLKIDGEHFSSFQEIPATEEQREEVKPEPPKVKPEFSTSGKLHPILQKVRATLGMTTIKPYIDVLLGGCTYRLHQLFRGESTLASSLAALSSTTETQYQLNFESALVAFSTDSIDLVPLVDAFNIAKQDEDGRVYTSLEREHHASYQFYYFLKASPNELTDKLAQSYTQEYPEIDLLDTQRETKLCPEDGCKYQRISAIKDNWFCPLHGRELRGATNLPNLSSATL